jgi:integrase
MATLERRNQSYRIVFWQKSKRYSFSLDTSDSRTAEALRGGVEKTLMLLGQGILTCPDDGDLIAFVRSGGKAVSAPKPVAELVTLAKLRDAYLVTRSNGSVEANTLTTIKIHLKHLVATYGERFAIAKITQDDVQRHIDRRLKQKHQGRPIGPVTTRKEVTTLRAMWTWGAGRGMFTGNFPSHGLTYPKTDAKPPFCTLAEVERKIAIGGLSQAEREALYESLYLRKEEIEELLQYVKENAAHPWIYPMIATAAYTGARRSELLRIEVTDVDLEQGVLLIREKKRSKKQRTTRHVSISPSLKGVLQDWLSVHPGGRFQFCQSGPIRRSRKRSETTGHSWGVDRPTSRSERGATVVARQVVGVTPVTKNEAHDHFKRTLSASKWAIIPGLHTLRHSFISCLAAAGVDQRIIDEFVGHSTDEQRRRYRHLIPDVKDKAITEAFAIT